MPALPKLNQSKRKAFISKIRTLKNQGAAFELQALYTLLQFEQLPITWKATSQTTFADVLREERLFPVSRYRSFKRAVKQLSKPVIEKLGVDAACLIAAQPAKKQFALIRKAQDFRKRHDVEPTYQYVSTFIRGRTPKKSGPSRQSLLNYIEKLKATIRSLRGRVPAMS